MFFSHAGAPTKDAKFIIISFFFKILFIKLKLVISPFINWKFLSEQQSRRDDWLKINESLTVTLYLELRSKGVKIYPIYPAPPVINIFINMFFYLSL